MKNNKEVGFTPDDNNDRRLPGSVQPESQRGNSSYHHLEMAKPTPLEASDTGGMVGKPTIGTGFIPTTNSNVSVSGPSGVVETTYSHENLSAKFKYPNIHQDIPPKGNPSVTFEDHT